VLQHKSDTKVADEDKQPKGEAAHAAASRK
jgi:hypothetical protein